MSKKHLLDSLETSDPELRKWKSRFTCARMAYEDGKFREAERLLYRALAQAEQLNDKDFALNASRTGLGAVQLAEGRLSEAKANLKKSLTALEAKADPLLKELYAVTLRFYADLLFENKKYLEAEKELKKAVSILEKLGEEASVQMAYTLADLCGVYSFQGRFAEATPLISRAMKVLLETLGPEDDEFLRAQMIGQICSAQADELAEVAENAGVRMQYQFGANHPTMLRAIRRYVWMLKEKDDRFRLEQAKSLFASYNKALAEHGD